MRVRLRSHLTYANVMATIAVFVALGGSSYAALSLSRNSVKSKHIGKGQVKRSDIGRNAVTSAKVANFSLLAEDFREGDLPPGPKGDTGPQGVPGQAGAPGFSASGTASEDDPSNPSLTSSFATLLDLQGGSTTGALEISAPSRMIAAASVYLRHSNSATDYRDADCRLLLQSLDGLPGGGVIGTPVRAQLGAGNLDGDGWEVAVPLTGASAGTVAPGTWDVDVQCSNDANDPDVRYDAGSLTVIAAGGDS